MNRRFYREITTFFGKYTFNIHFFVLNVHFSILNIHFCNPNVHFLFAQKSTYMKVSIMKLIFLVQKQISEKRFQILCCFVNTFLQVRIVCTDKSFLKYHAFSANVVVMSRSHSGTAGIHRMHRQFQDLYQFHLG